MNIKSAMERLIKQGTQDSELKKKFLLRKLNKDAKSPVWEGSMRNTLDDEWMLRLGMANLINRNYDWEGWGLRKPRELLIPNIATWWDGGKIDNLLILGEQGLGDEILFASIFNEIGIENITVECDKRLVPVFERSFPDIKFIGRKHYKEGFWGTDDTALENAHKKEPFDAQVLMGDLPTWYRRSISDFPNKPYLVAKDPIKTDLTGYSWIGRQGAVDIPMGEGISLQYGVDDHKGLLVPDFDLKDDVDELFTLVASLSKVVSVPTTIVHIAGSLGIPVELWLPKRGMDHKGFDRVNNALNWRIHDSGCDWHPNIKIMGVK